MKTDETPIPSTQKARMTVVFEIPLEEISEIITTLHYHFNSYWIDEISYLNNSQDIPPDNLGQQVSRRA